MCAGSVQDFDQKDCLRLEEMFPSDALVSMRGVLESLPALDILLQGLVRLRLVIDANIVQQEIRWRSGRRRNPAARSGLQEAIDSGIVVALAPTFLKSEIEDHLSDIAADTGVAIEEVRQHWQDFQPKLTFYEPQSADDGAMEVVDPDDVAYKRTCEELGADAVYSHDADLRAVKVPVISVSLDLTLRKHARSSSVVMGVTLGSGLTLMVSFESLRGLYLLIEKAVTGVRRLPAWAQLSIAGCVFAMLAHPKSRATLVEVWSRVCNIVEDVKPRLVGGLGEIALQFVTAQQGATETYAEVQLVLPKRRRRSAIQRARSICLVSKEPLSALEIERRMRKEGHSTRSKDFARYLRRLLRESEQFVEVTPGAWSLGVE
jgi:hypothetical protein